MDFLRGLVGGPVPSSSSNDPTASQPGGLLSDWQSYSRAGDVEAGPASAASNLSKAVEDVGSNVFGFLRTGYEQVSTGVNTLQQNVSTLQAPSFENSWVPTTTQLTYFFCLLGGGLVFLSLSFFVFLPIIIIAPSKFALCFTIGCMCVLSSFAALRGWQQQLQLMFTRERLPFTAGYLATVMGTLWAALFMHSYILSLAFSGLQVGALVVFVSTYFGGADAAQRTLGWFTTAGRAGFGAVSRMVV